ncbi:hypothetical protein B0F90DRAFT_1167705 [Multifurca ochricompacta]|uniref:Uncharacterized protein n=1 Tax=Multifurca ochricompacta TaxID=376703 RepID=A0AAD4M814_9AGAM|nr:hypothetical protein B0F90DRAFT_1167705 [Multifurca ochricompacta]
MNSQVDSTVYANIVFGFGKTSRRNGHYGPSSEEEQITAEPKNNVGQDHAPVAIVDNAPWKAMTAAFGALSLSTTAAAKKRHLPFLRRIVRSSFHRRCQKRGLATVPTSPSTQLLTICYKMAMDVSDSGLYNDPTEYVVYKVELTVGKLVCPLCDTLGGITTKEMLEAHLEWDHLEMEPSWRQKQSGNWELTLEIPGSEVQGDVWERAESSWQVIN